MDDVGWEDEDLGEITQEHGWGVITAYFDEKGLVRQQLDSFDEFIANMMQELVDDSRDIQVEPESQYETGMEKEDTIITVNFGQIYLSKPMMTESDGTPSTMLPHEARLRKLNPTAEIFRTQQSKVDPKNLIGIQSFDLAKTLEMDPEFLDIYMF